MEESIDIKLLVRYMQGKCTAEETRLVKEFLRQPRWQQALEELLEEDFKKFEADIPEEGLSTEWNKRFHKKYVDATVRPLWRRPWLGYAAACVLIFSIAVYFFNAVRVPGKRADTIVMLEKINSKGQRSKLILPDSSVVYLGAESRLQFPEKFGAGNREISLAGEAFFEIMKDRAHPFIIHTGAVQTKVLGTSFKISAFKGKPLTVSVATGKVSVARKMAGTSALQSLAVLTPGQEVNWNPRTELTEVNPVDAEGVKAWKDGTMTFVAASLGDIAEDLERWYNVTINFEDMRIKEYHVSLVIKGAGPLNHALDIICNTTHLNYKMKGKIITITKKGG